MAMPLGTDVNEDQLQALKDLLGVIKMREMSQMCARDLARYTHPPMARKAAGDDLQASKARVERIPTPKAVSEAFRRVVDGLPPEPRKRLRPCVRNGPRALRQHDRKVSGGSVMDLRSLGDSRFGNKTT
jgi:hypothetical protein